MDRPAILTTITVLFFGQLAEQFGRTREVEIPNGGCTVRELREHLAAADELLGSTLSCPTIRVALDQEIVGEDALVKPGREVAFFAPVSGG